MGDRGQIKIDDVYLYTHWNGTELFDDFVDALESPAGQKRLGDLEYLARIVFCKMISDDEDALTGETGYGIGTCLHGDLEHPLIVVHNYNISIVDEGDENIILGTWSFKEFLKNKKDIREKFWC